MSDDTCQAQLTLFPKAQAKLLLQGAEDLDLRQQHRTAASGLQIEGTAVHVAGMRRGTAVDRCLMRKDRKSTRLNSSHRSLSRMPSSA